MSAPRNYIIFCKAAGNTLQGRELGGEIREGGKGRRERQGREERGEGQVRSYVGKGREERGIQRQTGGRGRVAKIYRERGKGTKKRQRKGKRG